MSRRRVAYFREDARSAYRGQWGEVVRSKCRGRSRARRHDYLLRFDGDPRDLWYRADEIAAVEFA